MEDQENQNQEEQKDIGQVALEQGKQMVENAAKEAGKQVAKEAGKAAKQALTKAIVANIVPISIALGILIVVLLIVGGVYVIKNEIVKIANNSIDTISTSVTMSDNGPVVPGIEQMVNIMDEQLGMMNIDKSDLDIGDEEQSNLYLYKYMLASLSTQLPYIQTSTAEKIKDIFLKEAVGGIGATISNEWNSEKAVQGIVKIKRSTGGKTRDLIFTKYEDFSKLVEANDSSALNYFAIDNAWQLCVAKYSKTTTTGTTQSSEYTVDEVKIPYQTMISQYSVPFDFFIVLQQFTQNPEYVSAVADLIQEQGEIELTIFDSTEVITSEYTYVYDLWKKWDEEVVIEEPTETVGSIGSIAGNIGAIIGGNKQNTVQTTTRTEIRHEKSVQEGIEEKSTTITEINSIKANVTKANVWVISQNLEYTPNSTTEQPLGPNGVTVELEDQPEPPASEGEWRVNQKEITVETVQKEEWQAGTQNVKVDASKFLGLWRNDFGTYMEGANYNPNGQLVKYRHPARKTEWSTPTENIKINEEWIYETLENSESTQTHAMLMRYLIHLYKTGEELDIDLSIFNANEFTGVSSIVGGTIQEKVWFALRNAGFSEEATAGAMGNIHYESGGFNPTRVEGGYTETTGGIGICQWTNNNRGATGRNTSLRNFAASKGKTWQDEDIQVQFLLTELTGTGEAVGYANYQFLTTPDARYGRVWYKDEWKKAEGSTTDEKIENATRAFCYTFERPSTSAAIKSIDDRIRYAKQYYDQFQGQTAASGDYSGDVVRYYQNDYINVPYGSSTIKDCGCGPTAFAMVATQITGQIITPKDAVDWCGNAYYVSGAGTSWSYFRAATQHFGLPCTVTQTSNFATVENALKNGKLVISSQSAGLFTSGGHFILLTKMVNGRIYVNDPNKNNAIGKGYNNRAFTPAEIQQAGKQYWIFE